MPGSTVLRHQVQRLYGRLTHGRPDDTGAFRVLLLTPHVALDKDGLPLLDSLFDEVRGMEPWRAMLRHIADGPCSPQAMLERIDDPGDKHCYENFATERQLRLWYGLPASTERAKALENDTRAAGQANERTQKRFKSQLELDAAYGRIDEIAKETALLQLDAVCAGLAEDKEFGRCCAVRDALSAWVAQCAEERCVQLRAEVAARRPHANGDTALLDRAEALLQPEVRKVALAEECINRIEDGASYELTDPESLLQDNPFLRFISPACYDRLYQVCQRHVGGALRTFGGDVLTDSARRLSSQYVNEGRAMLDAWPNRQQEVKPQNIAKLLEHLGLSPAEAKPAVPLSKGVRIDVSMKPVPKDKAEYDHPIAEFGTQMRPTLPVMCLFGSVQPADIVNQVCGLELGQTVLVLLNGALSLAQRRQMAELFHKQKSMLNPFLLVDWVLALHLAGLQPTERLSSLLACAMPFSSACQPFIYNGGPAPDEMFVGRKQELRSIMDPNGAAVVYGGRRLGKTALLLRACSRRHHPDERLEFAMWLDATLCDDEPTLVAKIASKFCLDTNLPLQEPRTMAELCAQLDRLFRERRMATLLLLIDESDRFLEVFRGHEYRELQPLVDLRREWPAQFKFVLAGLHNVCRVHNRDRVKNSVINQLGNALCVRPLSPADSLRLLMLPLRYLGLRWEDSEHLELLVANTNYYAEILHMTGYRIADAVHQRYAEFYRAAGENPPFGLSEAQLGAIITSGDLTRGIQERLIMTLNVDHRYYILACCVAMNYYLNLDKAAMGYCVQEVYDVVQMLSEDISAIGALDDCALFLEEMVEMGILASPAPGQYRLRQQRFLQALGDNAEALERTISEKVRAHSEEARHV